MEEHISEQPKTRKQKQGAKNEKQIEEANDHTSKIFEKILEETSPTKEEKNDKNQSSKEES